MRLSRISTTAVHTIVVVALLVGSLCFAFYWLGFGPYVVNMSQRSTLIEDNYVDPRTTRLQFPVRKRNLIYITLESMEYTYTDHANGGIEPVNLIPNLTKLAHDDSNQSFVASGATKGFVGLVGTEWTAGSLVAQTSGLLLPLSLSSIFSQAVLPGAWSIGDVLNKEGYEQTFLLGSDAHFGQRYEYYTKHGGYNIYDYLYWRKINPNLARNNWWGIDDQTLYEYAKAEVSRLSAGNKPFNLSMLTVDTHNPRGYLCPLCATSREGQFRNVLSCADRQVAEFVGWAKAQTWYENTTIVVVGDHISMNPEYAQSVPAAYSRSVYNVFINSVPNAVQSNRSFSAMDMYPTTLAALGVAIPGDRLGLGSNLFSAQPTLLERFGVSKVNTEFTKKSEYYWDNLAK